MPLNSAFCCWFYGCLCVSHGFFAFDSTVIGHNPCIPIRCGIIELAKAYLEHSRNCAVVSCRMSPNRLNKFVWSFYSLTC